jgi:hypothetical protein
VCHKYSALNNNWYWVRERKVYKHKFRRRSNREVCTEYLTEFVIGLQNSLLVFLTVLSLSPPIGSS